MNESDRIEKLKKTCLELLQLRDDGQRYERSVIMIEEAIHSLKLEHLIDSGQLMFFLVQPVKGKRVSELSHNELKKALDEYFVVKDIDYYFQIAELKDFPDNYRLGHGTLFNFTSLPEQVKNVATSLSKHEIENIASSNERVWEEIFAKLVVPADPKIGHWLKVSCSSVSRNVGMDSAFERAEESVDILRIAVSTARFHVPQYAIALNKRKSKAFPVVKGIEFSRYTYNPRHQNIVDRLNVLYVKPSSNLEERIKDAIHFLRIADNNAPDYQRLFFYAAAIEHLILGSDDQDVLSWKFSEKGALLLSDDVKERLDLVKQLRAIYRKRSNVAHGTRSDYDFLLTTSSRNYLEDIVFRLLWLIDKYDLKTVVRNGKNSGKSLDEFLDVVINSGQIDWVC